MAASNCRRLLLRHPVRKSYVPSGPAAVGEKSRSDPADRRQARGRRLAVDRRVVSDPPLVAVRLSAKDRPLAVVRPPVNARLPVAGLLLVAGPRREVVLHPVAGRHPPRRKPW